MRWLWIPLAIIGVAMLIYGVQLGRYSQVELQANTTCYSCIGLSE